MNESRQEELRREYIIEKLKAEDKLRILEGRLRGEEGRRNVVKLRHIPVRDNEDDCQTDDE